MQGGARIAWSVANLQLRDQTLLEAIAAASITQLASTDVGSKDMVHRDSPQNLTNTAWAYSALSFRHLPLLDAIASASIATITAFEPQNLANPAWAGSNLSVAS